MISWWVLLPMLMVPTSSKYLSFECCIDSHAHIVSVKAQSRKGDDLTAAWERFVGADKLNKGSQESTWFAGMKL